MCGICRTPILHNYNENAENHKKKMLFGKKKFDVEKIHNETKKNNADIIKIAQWNWRLPLTQKRERGKIETIYIYENMIAR